MLQQFSWAHGHIVGVIQLPTASAACFIVPTFAIFLGRGSSFSTARPKAHSLLVSTPSKFFPCGIYLSKYCCWVKDLSFELIYKELYWYIFFLVLLLLLPQLILEQQEEEVLVAQPHYHMVVTLFCDQTFFFATWKVVPGSLYGCILIWKHKTYLHLLVIVNFLIGQNWNQHHPTFHGGVQMGGRTSFAQIPLFQHHHAFLPAIVDCSMIGWNCDNFYNEQ